MSKAGNGYIKFSNGIIIQWGQANLPATITYPTAFTATPRVSLAEIRAEYSNRNIIVNTVTSTSFYAFRYGNEEAQIQWIAIGY